MSAASKLGDRFRMVYCDNLQCRVNTFEVGGYNDNRLGPGYCPGCGELGNCLTCHTQLDECGCDE